MKINKELFNDNGEIPIGQRVEDLVSGLRGLSITRCIFLNGCIQHEIQPSIEEGEMQKTVWIDEDQLKALPFQSDKIRKTTMGNSIKLGYLFGDIITDFKGITIAYAKHYSGLQEYEIQPTAASNYDDHEKRRQSVWIPKNRLVEVKEEVYVGNEMSLGVGSGGGHRSHP